MALKAHIGLNVSDLDRSLSFYRTLFGAEPYKVKPDYAKFDLEDPALNFSISQSPSAGRAGGHFGIQVASTQEVADAAKRLAEAGLATYEEMGTTCCYALQDKVWATDPDGNKWEFFVVQADSESFRELIPVETSGLNCAASPCCA
jgi:catechol 2,3-dioxygenase-like lactoylglutathione lyase family enzyme